MPALSECCDDPFAVAYTCTFEFGLSIYRSFRLSRGFRDLFAHMYTGVHLCSERALEILVTYMNLNLHAQPQHIPGQSQRLSTKKAFKQSFVLISKRIRSLRGKRVSNLGVAVDTLG